VKIGSGRLRLLVLSMVAVLLLTACELRIFADDVKCSHGATVGDLDRDALFYLRGVAPESVKTTDIYRGVAPFVVMQLVMLGILAAFPAMATWLPKLLYGP